MSPSTFHSNTFLLSPMHIERINGEFLQQSNAAVIIACRQVPIATGSVGVQTESEKPC